VGTLEETIALLLAAAGVSSLAGTRVYPVSLPQGVTYPAATVYQASATPIYDDDGEAGLREERITVDCWGLTYAAAKTLARAVTETLSAYTGTPPGGSVPIAFASLEDERDDREGGGNSATYPFRTSLDFILWSKQ
jgi:hypothetical protein